MDKNYYDFRCTKPECGHVERLYKSSRYCKKCGSLLERVYPVVKKIPQKKYKKRQAEIVLSADFPKVMESVTELAEYFAACAARISEFICKDLIPAITHISFKIRESAYQAYLDSGAPYGESVDGLLCWLKELYDRELSSKEDQDGG
jgi:hypothetical protein